MCNGASLTKEDLIDYHKFIKKFTNVIKLGKIESFRITLWNCMGFQDKMFSPPQTPSAMMVSPERIEGGWTSTADHATIECKNDDEMLRCALTLHQMLNKAQIKSHFNFDHWTANANELANKCYENDFSLNINREYERDYSE